MTFSLCVRRKGGRVRLTLDSMDDAGYARRRGPMLALTVESLVATEGFTVDEAEALAWSQVSAMLFKGARTPGHLLRTITDATLGAEVGWLWTALPGTALPSTAWLCDLLIDDSFRRRGYATAALGALERELTERGVPRLGLNVFGHNTAAIALYRRLGYRVTAQQRSRALTEIGDPGGIQLMPMRDFDARIAALKADYAADRREEDDMGPREADEAAEHKIAGLLPDGVRTKGSFVRSVVAGGETVGWVWAGLPQRPRPGMGWLHNIEIDEAFRSRGHGSRVIAAVQHEFRRRGMRSLGLNVHGENHRAQALYERLGFRLMTQQMSKTLDTL